MTLRHKPHSSIFASYSFAPPCDLIESGKREEDRRNRQLHMVNVVTTTIPEAIHKRASHSCEMHRSHLRAPDNKCLPISEVITMVCRYATASAWSNVLPRQPCSPWVSDLAVGHCFLSVSNQEDSKGPEGVTFSSPNFPLDRPRYFMAYLQVASSSR